MSKKHRFRSPFDGQHPKASQTLLDSARQQFLSYFSITLGEIEVQNVSLSDI